MPDTRMTVRRGATYQRKVTWRRPLANTAYKAELTIRRRYDDAAVVLAINSVTNPTQISVQPDVSGVSVGVQIRLGADVTAALPLGTTFVASQRLSLLADPTTAWVVSWDVSVTSTTFVVAP